MANNVSHDDRAPSSKPSSSAVAPKHYPGTEAYVSVLRKDIESLTVVTPAQVKEIEQIEASLAGAKKIASGEVSATPKIINLAQDFVRAASFYPEEIGKYVRELTHSMSASARNLGHTLNRIIASSPVTEADSFVRARAEFTIQAQNSTVQRCYEFRTAAYLAYKAASEPPSEPRKAPAAEAATSGFLSSLGSVLRFSRT